MSRLRRSFYVRIFTTAGSESSAVTGQLESLIIDVSGARATVTVEPYDKLGLYSDRVTATVRTDERTALALFDAFLTVAASGWAMLPFDEEVTLREAGWDHRRTDEVFLHPSVCGAFLGVITENGYADDHG